MQVVPDSNIWISALVYGGKPLQLLEMGLEREIHLLTSPAIIDETLGVLRDEFAYLAEPLQEARGLVESACYGVFRPGVTLDVVRDDPDDNRVLELAIQLADVIVVTGDKHLLKLRTYQHVEIMTVGEFLAQHGRQ